jgi:hypothetical protein
VTNRQRIFRLYDREPNALTATQIARKLKSSPAVISSLLLRMVRDNSMRRINGAGPRGGYVYQRLVR